MGNFGKFAQCALRTIPRRTINIGLPCCMQQTGNIASQCAHDRYYSSMIWTQRPHNTSFWLDQLSHTLQARSALNHASLCKNLAEVLLCEVQDGCWDTITEDHLQHHTLTETASRKAASCSVTRAQARGHKWHCYTLFMCSHRFGMSHSNQLIDQNCANTSDSAQCSC